MRLDNASQLRYGTDTTKKAVLNQIRDITMLRSLICLADDVTNGLWYPANVGPNLLLIMQDLCRLPSTSMEEDPKMVIRQVAEFLDIDATPELIDTVAENTSFDRMKAEESKILGPGLSETFKTGESGFFNKVA